ncbi:DUF305 domain-containing protein [Streptomyces sp. NPDC047315]|uniref:DUF305 domain-containing protein n=1 Tax=Streptomyces sp. NPDC047315 TaxID=3155142 RepID=UPI0033C655D6
MFRQPSTTGTRGPAALAVAALVAALALSACDSDSGSDSSRSDSGSSTAQGSVVAPGKPGEAAKTLSPEQAAKAVPDDSPNAADFAYAEMMVKHHAQALTMTALVSERASSQQVKGVAERISAAQKPEIDAMNGWLKRFSAQKPKSGGHDHGAMTMPGMATEAQLAQLRAAKGEAFDDLFLKLMITHHEGAVSMAADALSDGRNTLVQEMANDVLSQQSAEIGRMQKM